MADASERIDPLLSTIIQRIKKDPSFFDELADTFKIADKSISDYSFSFGSHKVDPPFIIFKEGVSEQEFFDFASEDIKCELINGTLLIHTPASRVHEEIFGFLFNILKNYSEANTLGQVYGSRLACKIRDNFIC